MRAYSYERISRDDDGTAPSPENQLAINQRAITAAGDTLAGHEADRNMSGGDDERPGLERLIAQARLEGVTRIYISDWLRWGRGKVGAYYAVLAERAGLEILSSTEGTDNELVREIKWAAGGELIRATSRAVKARQAEYREGAQYIGGSDLIGYRWEGLGKTKAHALGVPAVPYRRVIVPEEIAIPRSICERFDPAGECATKTQLSREYGLTARHVTRILRHPVYAGGYLKRRSERPRRGRTKPVPWEEWEVIWDAHEAAIPRDLWERNQERLRQDKRNRGASPGCTVRALSGLLVCGQCRAPLVLKQSKRESGHVRYACPNPECPAGSWSMKGWVASLLPWLAAQCATEALARQIHQGYRDAYKRGHDDAIAQAEIATLRAKCRRLEDAIARGLILDTRNLERELGQAQRALRSAVEAQDRRSKLSPGIPSHEAIVASLRVAAERAMELATHPNADYDARGLLHRMIKEIAVQSPKEAEVTIRLNGECRNGHSHSCSCE